MFDHAILFSIHQDAYKRLIECGGEWPIHPFSWLVLTDYVRGAISQASFLRSFYIVDSSLIAVGRCIADAM